MKRRIFGSLRTRAICRPAFPCWPGLPRSFFRKSRALRLLPLMSNRPSLVVFTTSPAERQPTIASQASRRAARAGRIARTCSSMNSMAESTMSACAMSARQASRVDGSVSHSAAAWKPSTRPGISERRRSRARSTALARWLSRVTMTTRIGGLRVPARLSAGPGSKPAGSALAAIMRLGVVEGFEGDERHSPLAGEALRVAARLAAYEERDLLQLLLGLRCPGGGRDRDVLIDE